MNEASDIQQAVKNITMLNDVKKCLCNMATLLPSDAYLRTKKAIQQCSSLEKLEIIGVNLVKEVCGS